MNSARLGGYVDNDKYSKNEMSLNVALITYVILFYIFRIVQVHYQKDGELKQNKLTILPLVILLLYLVSLLGDNIVIYMNFDLDAKTVLVANTVNCFFWTAVTLVTCFEWEIITALVKF